MDNNITWQYQIADHYCTRSITWVYNKYVDPMKLYFYFFKVKKKNNVLNRVKLKSEWHLDLRPQMNAPRSLNSNIYNFYLG